MSLLLSNPRARSGLHITWLLAGMIILFGSVTFAVVGTAMGAVAGSTPAWAIVAGVASLGTGIGFLYAGGRGIYRASQLSTGELVVPRLPLRLGEPLEVHFSQRRSSRANVAEITAVLELQEWVRYSMGQNAHATDTHLVWSQELEAARPDDPIGDDSRLRGSWRGRIPADQRPSFQVVNNALQWVVRVTAETTKGRNVETAFVVPVLPEVIPGLEVRGATQRELR
ncbi:MAG: hypothetical protein Q4G46_06275 [Propionibacteriaceae bacterium]|nr:hypothetical protein [Propionibacteriaceae bacterium]